MRNLLISILTAILLLSVAVTVGCIGDDDDADKGTEHDTSGTDDREEQDMDHSQSSIVQRGMNDYVKSSNEFSFDMYSQLAGSHPGENMFFSPYSIATALGMAYEGAEGQTADEMADILDLPEDDEERWDMVRALQDSLNVEGASYDLSTANAYWLAEGWGLAEQYRSVIEDYYRAGGEQLDFAGDPAGSAEVINAWVEQETNGKIKDLVTPDMLGIYTFMVLTNAIYFKSSWQYEFDEEDTEDRDFTLSTGDTVTTPMMYLDMEESKLNYARNEDGQMVELPYKDGDLSMFVLLPDDNDVGALESELDPQYISDLMDGMESTPAHLYMPKFKLELEYTLNEDLKEMGMSTAFGAGADFSGITEETDLYIDKVVHKSFVEVNEEGTEAAAATAVVVNFGGIDGGDETVTFNADHPFIFFIQHEDSGQILFMGKVEDPRE